MKVLNGSELAGFIKERQARQVRSLRQSRNVFPKLAIVCTDNNPVTETYLRLKKSYGEDILVDVEVSRPNDEELLAKIDELNNDLKIQGVIIQLPLADPNLTERALSKINPKKDVDALNPVTTQFTSATAKAIDWLLGGYNVDLNYKKIVIVGQGRLVGAPLIELWRTAGYDITVCDIDTPNLDAVTLEADVLVTATGVVNLISSAMIKLNAIVVDAGTSCENGKIVGDLAEDVRQRDDLTITPIKGGVGPLTVTALFDNLILASTPTN